MHEKPRVEKPGEHQIAYPKGRGDVFGVRADVNCFFRAMHGHTAVYTSIPQSKLFGK